ncbi:hypothetical protein GB931_08165 [Modestobacter sp. I12A-02628]|uniref:GGDEF domain-containing protein n=1 Tax=Goekera deserti TaxID=2497753 RepID=A0A7K3WF97_9ACTN|nr:hypothetical protein [Goekera deserti]MPQ97898.1 hypothetical protein [Goekera deserti]NDI48544.1 hypothetical protein [Goekera deserti]NEL55077.1 hypothetical protein [Goekera deserti]
MTTLDLAPTRPATPHSAAAAAASAALRSLGTASVASLLPGRSAVLDHLAEVLPGSDTHPTSLVIVGLLRRDDTWPTAPGVLDVVTSLLAGTVRGDDWLGHTGHAEFAAVLSGDAADAEVAAARVLAAVTEAGIPGVRACAGVTVLSSDVTPAEALRRATLSLTVARSVGPEQVIRYSGSR